jgi:hypothetical protein
VRHAERPWALKRWRVVRVLRDDCLSWRLPGAGHAQRDRGAGSQPAAAQLRQHHHRPRRRQASAHPAVCFMSSQQAVAWLLREEAVLRGLLKADGQAAGAEGSSSSSEGSDDEDSGALARRLWATPTL